MKILTIFLIVYFTLFFDAMAQRNPSAILNDLCEKCQNDIRIDQVSNVGGIYRFKATQEKNINEAWIVVVVPQNQSSVMANLSFDYQTMDYRMIASMIKEKNPQSYNVIRKYVNKDNNKIFEYNPCSTDTYLGLRSADWRELNTAWESLLGDIYRKLILPMSSTGNYLYTLMYLPDGKFPFPFSKQAYNRGDGYIFVLETNGECKGKCKFVIK